MPNLAQESVSLILKQIEDLSLFGGVPHRTAAFRRWRRVSSAERAAAPVPPPQA